MFHAAIYENTRPDGVGVLEIVGFANGSGEDKPAPTFVPLKRSELHGEIVGPLADLRLRQTFGYTHVACPQTLEALYRFPLPGDAAVTNVTVRFGDVEIVATLQARTAAEADYTAAKAEGRQAALATREAPDVFTLQIAGLQPDQDIVVETAYVQLARSEGARWTLRIPLTTAPRYVRADERGARPAHGQPLALLRDPGHRFLLDLHLHGVENVTSPTHAIAVTEKDDHVQVQLQQGEVIPDRDCVLYWRGQQAEEKPHLTLFHQTITAAESLGTPQLYFLAQVAPPRRSPSPPLPREIILLVDHSGSMSGPKWAAADWAVERFLGDLQEQDSFALGIFHNETRWFAQQVQKATPATLTQAVTWLKQSTDSGGTELGVALEQALRLPRSTGEAARHLLIVTDAAVTDAARILRLADQEQQLRFQQLGQQPGRRISVICIDAAPNAFLAQELAERGGGVAKFLTSDPAQEDITTALDDVLAAWAEPYYVDLALHIHHPQVELSDPHTVIRRTEQTTVVDLGDLAGGQTRWIAGRIPLIVSQKRFVPHPQHQASDKTFLDNGIASKPITIDLQLANDTHLAHQSLGESSGATDANLRALFGARRVNALEYLMNAGLPLPQVAEQLARLGYDPTVILADQATGAPAVYAENARAQLTAALHKLLVEEALRYGLASAETAFVATRLEAGTPVQGRVIVANALPAGWSEQFVTGGPQRMRSMAAMPMPSALPAPTMQFMASTDGSRMATKSMATRAPQSPSGLPQAPRQSRGEEAILFHGLPLMVQGEALLYASAEPETLPAAMQLTGIALRLLTAEGKLASLDSTLATSIASEIDRKIVLQLFIGDPASPRARIRLQDLLRHGERPLNLARAVGQPIQLRLIDPAGWLQQHHLQFEIVLQWE